MSKDKSHRNECTFDKYLCNEAIKIKLISLRELRVHARYDTHDNLQGRQEHFHNLAKEQVIYEMLDLIKDFIKIEEHEDRGIVTAYIYMPYIHDNIIATAEKDAENSRCDLNFAMANVDRLEKIIAYLELPWWHKLILKLSKGEAK